MKIKKISAVMMALALSVTLASCGKNNKQSTTKPKTETETQNFITEITKDNVDDIVVEYKEVLSYYNDLKNNLKTISDVNQNPYLEKDAENTRDSLENSITLLKNTDLKYKPLYDAKDLLLKMYALAVDMSKTAVSDSDKYQEQLKTYDGYFKDFKDMMDQIRSDIESVRGTDKNNDANSTTEENDKLEEANKDENSNSSDDKDKNNENQNSNDRNNDSNSGSNNSGDNSSSNRGSSSSGGNSSSSGGSSDQGFVPKVSSLNSSIRSEIKSAGAAAGANFKQSGGTEDQIYATASQLFSDIEGDNPIQQNQIGEAKQIFINAFKNAYYSN